MSPLAVRGEWRGVCRRCARPILESIDLRLELPGRPRSAAELADPDLLERRRRHALELIADPATPILVREQLRRDYLDAPPDKPDVGLEDAGAVLERLRRSPGSD